MKRPQEQFHARFDFGPLCRYYFLRPFFSPLYVQNSHLGPNTPYCFILCHRRFFVNRCGDKKPAKSGFSPAAGCAMMDKVWEVRQSHGNKETL
jgi:hypothetical protein